MYVYKLQFILSLQGTMTSCGKELLFSINDLSNKLSQEVCSQIYLAIDNLTQVLEYQTWKFLRGWRPDVRRSLVPFLVNQYFDIVDRALEVEGNEEYIQEVQGETIHLRQYEISEGRNLGEERALEESILRNQSKRPLVQPSSSQGRFIVKHMGGTILGRCVGRCESVLNAEVQSISAKSVLIRGSPGILNLVE